MTDICLLGLLCMDRGTWADWFSGSMSAAAVAVAVSGYFITNRQRKADRLDAQREAAQSIAMKLKGMLDDFHSLNEHLSDPMKSELIEGPEDSIRWETVKPLIGLTRKDHLLFTPQEKTVFIDARENAFVNDLLLVERRHAVAINLMLEYNVRRDALLASQPAPYDFTGDIFVTRMSFEQAMAIRPYAMALQTLVVDLQKSIGEDLRFAIDVSERFGPIAKAYFRDPNFVSVGSAKNPI